MKSRPVGVETILATDHNTRRDDARGGSFLLPHQQLGALALGTGPSNGQIVTVIVNGTSIVFTAVTGTPTNPGDVKAPGTAAGFVTNLIAALRRPDVTTSTFIALASANQLLIQYVGWAWPGAGTSIVPFSLNKNVNGAPASLTSFNITTTVTSGSWTAQTMQLFIEDGTYYIGTTRVLFTGASTPTFTAPVSNPRIDIVTADSSGTIAITQGSENASPVAPSYPANKVVICEVYNVVGETALYDNENQQNGQGYILNDVRSILHPVYIGSSAQVAAGLFIADPGSEAQGDILYYNGAAWARLPAGTSGFALQTQGGGGNPQWVLMAQTAQIKDASGPNITPNADNAFHTIATYASVPAITTGQSIWIRGHITNSDVNGETSRQYRVQMNGTTIFTGTGGNSGGPDNNYFDVLIIVPTPASSQKYMGIIGGASNSFVYSQGTASANLSSSFSITVQYLQNSVGSPSFTGPVTLDFFEVNIFN